MDEKRRRDVSMKLVKAIKGQNLATYEAATVFCDLLLNSLVLHIKLIDLPKFLKDFESAFIEIREQILEKKKKGEIRGSYRSLEE